MALNIDIGEAVAKLLSAPPADTSQPTLKVVGPGERLTTGQGRVEIEVTNRQGTFLGCWPQTLVGNLRVIAEASNKRAGQIIERAEKLLAHRDVQLAVGAVTHVLECGGSVVTRSRDQAGKELAVATIPVQFEDEQ